MCVCVSSFKVKYCLKVSGRGAPPSLSEYSSSCCLVSVQHMPHVHDTSRLCPDFRVDLTLDRLKQKESTKRVFFLHSRTFQYSKNSTVSNGQTPACEEQNVFLRVRRRGHTHAHPAAAAS